MPYVEYRKAWVKANPEKVKAYKKRWSENNPNHGHEYYEQNKEQARERGRKWYQANKERHAQRNRAYRLRTKYRLTPTQYDELYIKQKGLCAICMNPEKKLHVDHCHTTGIVRGLLCVRCNTGIGNLRDDHIILENALKYLLRTQ